MKALEVIAHRWSGGWELHFNEDDITQSRTLEAAPQQVRDYLATYNPDLVQTDLDIIIRVEEYENAVEQAKKKTQEAESLLLQAAEENRALVHFLRFEKGLSIADTATILGVSKTRIQQLQKKKPEAA